MTDIGSRPVDLVTADAATEPGASPRGHPGPAGGARDDAQHLTTAVAAALAGAGLAVTGDIGPAPLLVAVAVAQAALVASWVVGTGLPGRIGVAVLGVLAAAGADAVVSVWTRSQLGALLPILAPAMLLMFIHQLTRGVVRTRVVESLSDGAVLIVGVVALSTLIQLRHEFAGGAAGPVVAAVVGAGALALVVGHLVDVVFAVPRFDPAVSRGLLATVVGAAAAAAVGYLRLRTTVTVQFTAGRGVVLGAALGAVIGLIAVGVAFIVRNTDDAAQGRARWLRPVYAALLPLALFAPVGYVLCLAVRG